jgi:chemotaxis protein MotA
MDFATLIGLLLGAIVLVGALFLGQVPWALLFKPEALLIVFGGTFTAVLVSFSAATLWRALHAARSCFFKETFSTEACVGYLTEVATFVRVEGVLALQALLPGVEIPFLRKGLALIVDNRPEAFIRDSMMSDIELAYREQTDYARVFEAAGGYAPTMGLIGAVIGLIHVVQIFHDPVALGKGVAGAFSATLYGVTLSNMLLLPLAGKLRQRARDERFRKLLMLEGLLSIRLGEHPLIVEEKLISYLHTGDPVAPIPWGSGQRMPMEV